MKLLGRPVLAPLKMPPMAIVAVCLCLFLSGLAGLVYEIAWTRYLALFTGHTSYAVVEVLVAFMGGLALGNVLVARRAARSPRPLAFYGWLELGIGALAALFPFYYEICYGLYLTAAGHFQPGSTIVFALKFLFGLLTVLAPTVLMGGTIPTLARLVTRGLGDVREKVSLLYAINSAGAVVGIWLADWKWIPATGLQSTLFRGAALNILAGGVALGLSRWLKEGTSEEASVAGAGASNPLQPSEPAPSALASAATPSAAGEAETFINHQRRVALVSIGAAGFLALLFQVGWTRVLALALSSTTHAFSLMLMVYIAGLALGGQLIRKIPCKQGSLVLLARIELALAAVLALTMWFYPRLGVWFAQWGALLSGQPASYPIYEAMQASLCAATMLPPTVLMGMTLPLACGIATESASATPVTVGRVFAFNTLGAMLGAVVTGFLLLPLLGLARVFALGTGATLLLGLVLLQSARTGEARPPNRRLLAAAGTCAILLILAQFSSDTWKRALTLGLWRAPSTAMSWGEQTQRLSDPTLLYYKDGSGATVSVHRHPNDDQRFLKINGKTDASNVDDMPTQLMLGHVPMLLHPESKKALVVGLGAGVTAGAIASHPGVARLDIVELLPEVVEAARHFEDVNGKVLSDPRTHLIIEDARSFLQLTDDKYDIIVSEPSNPWMAGVADVFTVEFYLHCRDRLPDNGLMVQWVHLAEFSDESFETVLATFGRVFSFISIWQTEGGDALLVGSTQPPETNLKATLAEFAKPSVLASVKQAGIDHPSVLLLQEVVSWRNGVFISPPEARVHSDFNPVLEYTAQRDFFTKARVTHYRAANENATVRPTTLFGEYVQGKKLDREDFEAMAKYLMRQDARSLDLFVSLLLRWQRDDPQAATPIEYASRIRFSTVRATDNALRLAQHKDQILKEASRDHTIPLRRYGLALMAAYREERSALYLPDQDDVITVLKRLLETDPNARHVYQAALAELAWDAGRFDECESWAKLALTPAGAAGIDLFKADYEAPVRATRFLAETLVRQNKIEAAWKACYDSRQAGFGVEGYESSKLLLRILEKKLDGAVGALPHQPR